MGPCLMKILTRAESRPWDCSKPIHYTLAFSLTPSRLIWVNSAALQLRTDCSYINTHIYSQVLSHMAEWKLDMAAQHTNSGSCDWGSDALEMCHCAPNGVKTVISSCHKIASITGQNFGLLSIHPIFEDFTVTFTQIKALWSACHPSTVQYL